MRCRALLLVALASALSLATACEGDDAPTPGEEDTSTDASSGDGGASSPMVEGGGVVTDLFSGEAIANAEVCLFMEYDIGCVFSDASGAFTLPPLPSQALRATQVRKQGHAPVITWFTVPTEPWTHSVQLLPQDVTDALVDSPGGGLDTSRGHIVIRAVDSSGVPAAGVTIQLAPSPASSPAFLDVDGVYDATLEATAASGVAVVPNLVEGAVDVTVLDASGSPCLADSTAEPGDEPASVRLRVLAGHWAAPPGLNLVCG